MNEIIKEDISRIINQDINWDKLRNSTVLITGASGMLGVYFVYTLLLLNEEKHYDIDIICAIRNEKKLPKQIKNNSKVKIYIHDVSNPFIINDKVDYIIHSASPASPLIMKNDPVGTVAANSLGAFYTLSLAKEKKSKGYLFISSREIYGQPNDEQDYFTEETYGFVDPLDPRSCYPEGKKVAETMCSAFHAQYGINTKIARLAHTYGPGMSIYDGRVQADFLKNVINNEDILLKSDGSSIRTYTYVGDAVAGIWRAFLNGKELVYNIGDENAKVSIRELAELLINIEKEKKLKLIFEIEEKKLGCAPFTKGILSSKKIRELGWRPQNTIEEGFSRTIKYLKTINE